MCGAFWSAKCDNEDPVLLPTLRLVCRKNGTKLHLKHFITWCLQSLTSFKCCEKEWQHYKVVNALLSNFFWNVLQVWMTGKDVYLQMTWSWPDKTWNIFVFILSCNEIQVKVNLEITTFFFYLRFPYCPNFFWFGVVYNSETQSSINKRACLF